VNKTIQELLDAEVHKFELDPKYERVLNSFKTEIGNLEVILNDPESVIYDEIKELKRQVDLNREELKSQIDKLADDVIQKLESFEAKFKSEFREKVDLEHYNDLVEFSKQQLAEYEKCLGLFSSTIEEKDERIKVSERMVNNLQCKIEELKDSLTSNLSIKYKPIDNNRTDLFGKLKIHVNFLKIKSKLLSKFKLNEIKNFRNLKIKTLWAKSKTN
jgi:chromosome segregation ATPase